MTNKYVINALHFETISKSCFNQWTKNKSFIHENYNSIQYLTKEIETKVGNCFIYKKAKRIKQIPFNGNCTVFLYQINTESCIIVHTKIYTSNTILYFSCQINTKLLTYL